MAQVLLALDEKPSRLDILKLCLYFFIYGLGLLIENIRVASALTPKYGYSQYYT